MENLTNMTIIQSLESIKEEIKNGTYDWDKAIETTAEKLILLNSLGMYQFTNEK